MLGHIKALEAGKHHSKTLQRAWDKYGAEAFSARPLAWLPPELKILRETEGRAIETFRSWEPEFGFNHCRHPEHSTKDLVLTDEHKQKLREAKLGKKRGPYGPRKKETKPRKSRGRRLSEEHVKKVSEARRGKGLGPKSEEAKENMSKAAVERWKKPGQKENQAENLKKQREADPEFSSKAGTLGNQIRWGNRNTNLNNSDEK